MRFVVPAISMAIIAPAVHAQEVSVPSVTTASPGGYANPLQLDIDRDKRAIAKPRRDPVPFGLCKGKPLTKAERAALETGYITRAKESERRGARWLREKRGPNEAWAISRAIQRRGGVR